MVLFNRVTLPLICALAVALSLAVPVCSFADVADDAPSACRMDLLTNMTKAPVRMQVVGVTETLMPMEREPVSRCLQTGLIRGGMRAAFGMALTGR